MIKYLVLLLTFCASIQAQEIETKKISVLFKAVDLTSWTWTARGGHNLGYKIPLPLLAIMIKTKLNKISQITITDLLMEQCRHKKWQSNNLTFLFFSNGKASGNIITQILEPCILNYRTYRLERIKLKLSVTANGINYYRILNISSLNRNFFTRQWPSNIY